MTRALVLTLTLAACTAAGPSALPSDQAAVVSVADGLRLTIDDRLRPRSTPSGTELVLRGSSPTFLDAVEWAVGSEQSTLAALAGTGRFEVGLTASEVASLVGGAPLSLEITERVPSLRTYDARVELGAGLQGLHGSAALDVTARSVPVYRRGNTDTLRLRTIVHTTTPASSLVVHAGAASPEIRRQGPLDWTIDLTVADARSLVAAGGDVVLTADLGGSAASQQGRFVVRVADVVHEARGGGGLGPLPTCDLSQLSCAIDTWGSDLSTCGTWYEVSTCDGVDACDLLPPEPIDLAPVDATVLDGAALTWDADCGTGGTWCGMSDWQAFALPACLADDAVAVFREVIDSNQAYTWSFPFQWGQVRDRAATAAAFPFNTSYGADGPALLASIDAFVGASDSVSWFGENEIPCPNCHEFEFLAILYYPSVQRVVVLQGVSGYDS